MLQKPSASWTDGGPRPRTMATLITKKLQSQRLDALAHKSYDTGSVSCPPWVRGRCPGWVSAGGGDGGGWASPQGGPGVLSVPRAPQGSDRVLASLNHCEGEPSSPWTRCVPGCPAGRRLPQSVAVPSDAALASGHGSSREPVLSSVSLGWLCQRRSRALGRVSITVSSHPPGQAAGPEGGDGAWAWPGAGVRACRSPGGTLRAGVPLVLWAGSLPVWQGRR